MRVRKYLNVNELVELGPNNPFVILETLKHGASSAKKPGVISELDWHPEFQTVSFNDGKKDITISEVDPDCRLYKARVDATFGYSVFVYQDEYQQAKQFAF